MSSRSVSVEARSHYRPCQRGGRRGDSEALLRAPLSVGRHVALIEHACQLAVMV